MAAVLEIAAETDFVLLENVNATLTIMVQTAKTVNLLISRTVDIFAHSTKVFVIWYHKWIIQDILAVHA